METVSNLIHFQFLKLRGGNVRINQYHCKVILLLFMASSFSFLIIANNEIKSRENGQWNNYGIDCDIVQRVLRIGIFYPDPLIKSYNLQSDAKLRPLLNCFQADEPFLTEALRKMIINPTNKDVPYNLMNKTSLEFNSDNQPEDINDMIFRNMTNGFFIELGALDCETKSVSLPFEHYLNWTGLLIESLDKDYESCLQMNRKAYLLKSCVGTKDHPYFADFAVGGGYAPTTIGEDTWTVPHMSGLASEVGASLSIQLQCFPLYSILLSMGNPTVNLFILDIEGFELAVLRSIPWDKVDIEVLEVETDLAGLIQKDSSRQKIIDLLDKKGYARYDHRNDYNKYTKKNQNDLFVRRDVIKKYNVKQL